MPSASRREYARITTVTPDILECVPAGMARQYTVFPLRRTAINSSLVVAVPSDLAGSQLGKLEVRLAETCGKVQLCLVERRDILRAIADSYK